MTVVTKYGAILTLSEFRAIEVVTELDCHSRKKSLFHCTVVATRVFRDMYGHEERNSIQIQDFDSLLEAETFAKNLRDAMPKIG